MPLSECARVSPCGLGTWPFSACRIQIAKLLRLRGASILPCGIENVAILCLQLANFIVSQHLVSAMWDWQCGHSVPAGFQLPPPLLAIYSFAQRCCVLNFSTSSRALWKHPGPESRSQRLIHSKLSVLVLTVRAHDALGSTYGAKTCIVSAAGPCSTGRLVYATFEAELVFAQSREASESLEQVQLLLW